MDMGNKHWRLLAGAAAILIGLGTGGCASGGLFGTPEERVAKRAQARLDALLERDFEAAYGYVSPALREVSSLTDYAYRYAGASNWKRAEVQEVSCAVERCDVSFEVDYQMFRPKVKNTRSLDEVWIGVDGDWYLYYD